MIRYKVIHKRDGALEEEMNRWAAEGYVFDRSDEHNVYMVLSVEDRPVLDVVREEPVMTDGDGPVHLKTYGSWICFENDSTSLVEFQNNQIPALITKLQSFLD